MSNVNSPKHYNQGEIECIDAIESAVVNLNGIEAYLVGNAIKYIWRHKQKGGIESLEKAIWHLERQIDILIDTEDELEFKSESDFTYLTNPLKQKNKCKSDNAIFLDKNAIINKDLHGILESIAVALREPK